MPGRDCTASAGRLPPEGTKPDRRGLTAAPHSTGIGEKDCAGDSSLPSAPRVRVIHPDTATGPVRRHRRTGKGSGRGSGTERWDPIWDYQPPHIDLFICIQDLWASP